MRMRSVMNDLAKIRSGNRQNKIRTARRRVKRESARTVSRMFHYGPANLMPSEIVETNPLSELLIRRRSLLGVVIDSRRAAVCMPDESSTGNKFAATPYITKVRNREHVQYLTAQAAGVPIRSSNTFASRFGRQGETIRVSVDGADRSR